MNIKTFVGRGSGSKRITEAVEEMEKQFNAWTQENKNCRIFKTQVEYLDSNTLSAYAILAVFYSPPI